MVEVFLYLLVAHLIGDWLIQSHWMATRKSKDWRALFTHVFTYHVFVFGALYLAGVSLIPNLLGTLFLAVTHAVLDNRRFEIWWTRKVKKVWESEEIPTFLLLGVDQSFHLVLMFIVSYLVG